MWACADSRGVYVSERIGFAKGGLKYENSNRECWKSGSFVKSNVYESYNQHFSHR